MKRLFFIFIITQLLGNFYSQDFYYYSGKKMFLPKSTEMAVITMIKENSKMEKFLKKNKKIRDNIWIVKKKDLKSNNVEKYWNYYKIFPLYYDKAGEKVFCLDEIVIEFNSKITKKEISNILKKYNLKIKEEDKHQNIYLLKILDSNYQYMNLPSLHCIIEAFSDLSLSYYFDFSLYYIYNATVR